MHGYIETGRELCEVNNFYGDRPHFFNFTNRMWLPI